MTVNKQMNNYKVIRSKQLSDYRDKPRKLGILMSDELGMK